MGDSKKKPGFFTKLFSSKPRETQHRDDDRGKTNKRESLSCSCSSSAEGGSGILGSRDGKDKAKSGTGHKKSLVPSVKVAHRPPDEQRQSLASKSPPSSSSSSSAAAAKSKKPGPVRPSQTGHSKDNKTSGATKPRRLSRKKTKKGSKGDVAPANPNQRLEFPTTPEMILSIHKRKPFLDKNEEWLVVELNEYECLVENLDIIKTIANHSKFFEVEPDELWEEFFEFVEDMPSYDEVINYDVWQEFRDEKYPC